MFLDFDGTLAEIAARPDLVVIDKRLPDVLRRLQDVLNGAVAIVSGRPQAELDAMLAPLDLPRSGKSSRSDSR
jgi:trehalose 6-phosphate phosphatase